MFAILRIGVGYILMDVCSHVEAQCRVYINSFRFIGPNLDLLGLDVALDTGFRY